jgi:23S rRNA (adenine2503-C2)-methyltransferase
MSSTSLSSHLFSFTATEFQLRAVTSLGRGADQALAVYKEWHRLGSFKASDPCFSNCPQLREELLHWAACALPRVVLQREDGACLKLVLALEDGLEVETVVIPMQAGDTVCVSSQVGCAMGCAFCETGRMGLLRSLTAAEIVSQVWMVRHHLGRTPRNIVFMGMGEPFDNFDQVHQAIRVLTDPHGQGFGPRHITISTVGRVDGIRRMLEEMDPALHLALSLNAPSDQVRDRIMPMNKQFNMSALKKVLQEMTDRGRSVLVEYVLLAELTDQAEHADQVADFLNGLNVRVNCIPYNPQTRARFSTPSDAAIESFMRRLRERGVPALLRHHKGRSAMAACGQLGNVGLRSQLRQLKTLPPLDALRARVGH